MTSDGRLREAYVWTWLPGSRDPVVAGRLADDEGRLVFNYGQTYLRRPEAIPLYLPELPLAEGVLPLLPGLNMPSCIRDGAPDAWGRRVIINGKFGLTRDHIDIGQLDELTFLLESGSDRIGSLDFQASPTAYVPRGAGPAPLEELLAAAERVEAGIPLTPALDQALFHGSSIGGARPKATIAEEGRKYIAKFSSQSDVLNVVKAEFVAMRLAAAVGLDVAPVRLVKAAGRDVLLIERFDRNRSPHGETRRAMVSALTMLGLDEMLARYASYEDLAEIIRHRFDQPAAALRELFGRLVFNILCGNTDDHARNHSAFWDGKRLALTPAYDICPQSRAGQEASQAMLIAGENRMSQLSACLAAAPSFHLDDEDAAAIIESQIVTVRAKWHDVCEEASLSAVDRIAFWGRQFMNPFAFIGTDFEPR